MRFSLFLIVFTYVNSTVMAQFTATMKNVVSGNERIYQVYTDGENYRYEFTEDGAACIVIVKPSKNQTLVLMPEKKYVHHTTCNGRISFMNDPVQYAFWYRRTGNVVDEGEEKVGSYVCKKQLFTKADRVVFTIWQSEKLNFPLKIENYFTDNTYMEVMDIKEWKANKSYFIIPPDYISVDDEMRPIILEPPTPGKWVSRSVALPFNGVLKRGEKVSMDIPEAGHYKIKVRNEGDTPTKYIYHLYENGKKLPSEKVGEDDSHTHRLFMEEKRTFTYTWEKDWKLIIEGHEGEVMMEVYLGKSTIN